MNGGRRSKRWLLVFRHLPDKGNKICYLLLRESTACEGMWILFVSNAVSNGLEQLFMGQALDWVRSKIGGYQGGSQAGWVVPLAVKRAPVDFAIISFGLAVTVLQEDQESVDLDMYYHHRSAEDTKKALALARAGERVFETRGKAGYEAFDALRQQYKSESWYKDVHGDFLFFIMPLDKEQIIDAMT
jgi:hypothetical protein